MKASGVKGKDSKRWQKAILGILLALIMFGSVIAMLTHSTSGSDITQTTVRNGYIVNPDNVTISTDGNTTTVLVGQSVQFLCDGNKSGPVTVSGVTGTPTEGYVFFTSNTGWLDTSGMIEALYNATYGEHWELLEVSKPVMNLKLKVGEKEVSTIAVGTPLGIDFNSNLDGNDCVDLKVVTPEGYVLKQNPADPDQKFDDINVTQLLEYGSENESKRINTTGWKLGTYTFSVRTEKENAKGLEVSSNTRTLAILKAEIDIAAEKTSVVELEKVRLIVCGIYKHNITISSSDPAHTIFPTGYEDNPPYDTSGFNDTIDADGQRRYVVYFNDTGTYTIGVNDTTAGLSDAIDITVTEKAVIFDVPSTVVIGTNFTIKGAVNTGNTVDIAVKDYVYPQLNNIVIKADGTFEKEIDTSTTNITPFTIPGTVRLAAFIDRGVGVGEIGENETEDGSVVILLVSPGLTAELSTDNVAQGDDFTIGGTAMGSTSVDIVVVAPKGSGGSMIDPCGTPLQAGTKIYHAISSVSAIDYTFAQKIDVGPDVETANYLVVVLSKGRDGEYGYGYDNLTAAIAPYNLTGKTQAQVLAILEDATVGVAGSDDLMWNGYIKVEAPFVKLNPIADVAVGEPLVVTGTSNRKEGHPIVVTVKGTIELTPQMAKVENGTFSATFDTSTAQIGTYVVKADDGDGHTDEITVNIVPPLPFIVNLSTDVVSLGSSLEVYGCSPSDYVEIVAISPRGGNGTGMDGLYGVSIYTVPTFKPEKTGTETGSYKIHVFINSKTSENLTTGEPINGTTNREDGTVVVINVTGPEDGIDINVTEESIEFEMPSTCVIGENLTINGTANAGNIVDIAIDDIIKAGDIPIENGTFHTAISTVGYSPGSYKIEGFLDGNYSVGEDVSGEESDGSTAIRLIAPGLTVNISTNETYPGGSFVINGTATGTDHVDIITISPSGGDGTGLYEKSYPDVPGITNESIPVENNSFLKIINVSGYATVSSMISGDGGGGGGGAPPDSDYTYKIWVSVPGRDGYYGDGYGDNASDILNHIIDYYCSGDVSELRSKTQDQILDMLKDATINMAGSDDLAGVMDLTVRHPTYNFYKRIKVDSGADTGNYTTLVLSPGIDDVYGNSSYKYIDSILDLDGVGPELGAIDVSNKTQEEIVSIIKDATINQAGSDDLLQELHLIVSVKENLIINGDFSDGLNNWTERGYGIGNRQVEVVYDDTINSSVLEFKRWNSGADGGMEGVYQNLSINVSEYKSLYLEADIKVISNTLGDSGWWSDVYGGDGEFPVHIFLYYKDENGTDWLWTHGFLPVKDYWNRRNYDVVNRSEWYHYVSPNLVNVSTTTTEPHNVPIYSPPPKTITGIFLGGKGWDFCGRIDNVRLYGEKIAPTPSIIYIPDDYAKIQWAVDNVSAGSTIIVRDGIYTENVDVNKRLTIRSENGSDKTIVQAANSSDHVFDVRADYVNISGFTVKGAIASLSSGIYLYDASYCNISNNNASNNLVGFDLGYSSNNNNITNNIVSNNKYGINLPYYSSNNTITNNIVLNNHYYGICLSSSSNNTITNNNASNNNNHGIYLGSSSNNNITNNIISNNKYGIFLYSSSDNKIYLNNFINNINSTYSSASKNNWNSTKKITYTYNSKTYTNYLGNYWSDYNGLDRDGDGIGDTPYSIDSDKDNYPLVEPWENYFAPIENIFDTGSPANPYPSIFGTHNGTITPFYNIEVSKLYTYPCLGTGGHTEYIKIWNTSGWNVTANWNGYVGDWQNISFKEPFTLQANERYNYTICTGSYPQIHHNKTLTVPDGEITCTKFTDANGRVYYDWIPAFRFFW